MYRIYTILSVTVFCLLSLKLSAIQTFTLSPVSDNKPDYVLILSSYEMTNEWSYLIERSFSSHFQGADKMEVLTEYLGLSPQISLEQIKQKTSEVKNKYPSENKLVILLGEDAWIFYRTFLARHWQDQPAIAVFSGSHTAHMRAYLTGKRTTEKNKISLEDSRQGINATIIHDKIQASKTIGLMKKLLPGIDSIALVTDNRRIGAVVRQEVEQAIRDEYPSLKLINLNMRNYSSEQLKDALRKLGQRTGIIFHSWYMPDTNLSSKSLSNNMKLMIENIVHAPVFTLYDSGVKEGVITGGYYVTIESIAAELNKITTRILAGEKASDIPITPVPNARAFLNYQNLAYFNIPPQLYPRDAIYYEKPVDSFERNKRLIIYVITIAVLLACIFCLLVAYKHKQLKNSKRLKEALEKSNRLQAAFIANMNHEIRTPLNSIIGFSALLSEPEMLSKEDRQNAVQILTENKDHLLQLINNIIDLSQIESGGIELHYEPVDLNSVISDTVNIYRKKSDNPQLRIVSESDDSLTSIPCDWKLLIQVLNNLMDNALKHTQQGEIRIGYQLRKDEVYLFVADTGCGIPEDIARHIFDRFDKGNSNHLGGGVGLTLCKAIVNELGGEIGLSSKPGEGSMFWFTLPIEPYEKKK